MFVGFTVRVKWYLFGILVFIFCMHALFISAFKIFGLFSLHLKVKF